MSACERVKGMQSIPPKSFPIYLVRSSEHSSLYQPRRYCSQEAMLRMLSTAIHLACSPFEVI